VPKKAQFTHEWVEYNVFLFDEPLKGSKSLKTFKISLTFRFDKLWHLSKSVHITGENSQILTVSNKKIHNDIRPWTLFTVLVSSFKTRLLRRLGLKRLTRRYCKLWVPGLITLITIIDSYYFYLNMPRKTRHLINT
jgi:hypothetical protein